MYDTPCTCIPVHVSVVKSKFQLKHVVIDELFCEQSVVIAQYQGIVLAYASCRVTCVCISTEWRFNQGPTGGIRQLITTLLSVFSEARRTIYWAASSWQWVDKSYQLFRFRYALCQKRILSSRYNSALHVRVYTFSFRGVQLYLYLRNLNYVYSLKPS